MKRHVACCMCVLMLFSCGGKENQSKVEEKEARKVVLPDEVRLFYVWEITDPLDPICEMLEKEYKTKAEFINGEGVKVVDFSGLHNYDFAISGKDLRFFPNVEKIKLAHAIGIDNLLEIKTLQALEFVNYEGSRRYDSSKMPWIKEVYITSSRSNDYKFLEGLTSLETIVISCEDESNAFVLPASLSTSLKNVSIAGPLSDFSWVNKSENLEVLELISANYQEDVVVDISNMKKLKSFLCNRLSQETANQISGCIDLIRLKLSGSFQTIPGIEQCSSLVELDITGMSVANNESDRSWFSGILKMPSLKQLIVDDEFYNIYRVESVRAELGNLEIIVRK